MGDRKRKWEAGDDLRYRGDAKETEYKRRKHSHRRSPSNNRSSTPQGGIRLNVECHYLLM